MVMNYRAKKAEKQELTLERRIYCNFEPDVYLLL